MKNKFSHKKIIAAVTSILAAGVLLTACAAPAVPAPNAAPQAQTESSAPAEAAPVIEQQSPSAAAAKQPEGALTAEEAKAIALKESGVSAESAEFLRVDLDIDDGRAVYEIEFLAGNTEHEYEINALTGAILKAEKETRKSPSAAPAADQWISEDAAKNAALAHAGISAENAKFRRTELDRNRSAVVYEIEFTADGIEFEYEIDALTGSVAAASREKDRDLDDLFDDLDDRFDDLEDRFDD